MPDWTHQIQQILSMIGNVFITKMRAVVADSSKPIHLMHSSTYELPVHWFHSTEGDGAIAWVVKFNLAKKDDVHSTVMGSIHSLIYFSLLNHHSSQHNHNNHSASLNNIYTHKTTSIWPNKLSSQWTTYLLSILYSTPTHATHCYKNVGPWECMLFVM